MKIVPLILVLFAAPLLAGCTTGLSYSPVVIEAGAPRPGDADYARAMAVRISRERAAETTRLVSANENAVALTRSFPKN